MTRKTLTGWAGLVVAALLLGGCVAARPSQDQLDAWGAAVESVPGVGNSTVFAASDVEGRNYGVEIWVTLNDHTTLTYDLAEGVYEALVAATPEKFRDKTALVMFHDADHPDDPYEPLPVEKMFADAGVSCGGSAVCSSNDGVYLQMSLDPNGSGFPSATKIPTVQPRPTDASDIQGQAWIDAAVASSPDVVSAQVEGVGDEFSGDAVTLGVTLRSGTTLTLDLMQSTYDALLPVTEVGWNRIEMRIWFSYADNPDVPLPVGRVLREAGMTDPGTGAAYGNDALFLPVVLIRESVD